MRPRLSDDELRELLGLIEGADTVELKLTVPESDRNSALSALGVDPLQARVRQVFFFDTPDLSLYEHGVVARARRTQTKSDDSVIKLRPVVPNEIPPELRATEDFGVEVDAMPGGYVCSASYKRELQAGKVMESVTGRRSLRKLFSKQQRAFFAMHAPDRIELDDLAILGPINVLKLKFAPEGLARRIAVELWSYPSGSRILELSTKCSPGDAFQAAVETRAYLGERGVDLDGKQETKTRTALAYLSRALQGTTD
ncbi:MAG: adenylate cyclase [Actinomycetota bacterium]